MKIAIHQPNYLPWAGYFSKIDACDVFVFLDDVQYIKDGYIQRTRIRSEKGPKWLTCSVDKPSSKCGIDEVTHAKTNWLEAHLSTLKNVYGSASFFNEVVEVIFGKPDELLADSLAVTNRILVGRIADYLGIKCKFVLSSELDVKGASSERLLNLVKILRGNTYFSGKGAESYMDHNLFKQAGIEIQILDYKPIKYEQKGYDWMPGLSIIDALFYKGPSAIEIIGY